MGSKTKSKEESVDVVGGASGSGSGSGTVSGGGNVPGNASGERSITPLKGSFTLKNGQITSVQTSTVLSRFASMEEVERVMKFALDTSAESCMPFMLMEAHLNLAELNALRGDQFQGEGSGGVVRVRVSV
jgi:hypothetical protein